MSKRINKSERFEKSQFEPLTERLLIGIDPGTETGFAIWNQDLKQLTRVMTYSVLKAQDEVKACFEKDKSLCLIIEDARKRKWYGENSDAKRMGAGSVKRDCTIWVEFCNRNGIPYRLDHPKRGFTKIKDAEFKILTGWMKRTSEHARVAALLVFRLGRF
ncbi:hypothetical protein [Leptospira noguchii]|uniref:hypothetical protein n=1 Tax=Leptospira noguchii TaxID=28182 RepID=UPI0003284C93|nr:hypothetical protein [Leptospira noguchii]EMS84074.1 hypothetical protein LEP1GSC073_2728 [Leptospira noguchii str. Cascata]